MHTFQTIAILATLYAGAAFGNVVVLDERTVSPEDNQDIDFKADGKILDNPQATVTISATAKGSLSLSGGGRDDIPDLDPDANFTAINSGFDFDQLWVGAAFNNLTVHIDLGLNLHPTGPSQEFSKELGRKSFGKNITVATQNIAALTLDFVLQLHGWLNTTQPANLSYGFDVVVPPHSLILLPVDNKTGISSYGFDQSKVVPGNLTSSTSALAFDFEFSLRPIMTFKAKIGSKSFDAGLHADIPSLDLSVSQVNNVNAKCEPSPPGAAAADVFPSLTHIKPSAGFDLVLDVENNVTVLANTTKELPTGCLEFFPKQSILAMPSKEKEKSAGSHISALSTLKMILVTALVLLML